MNACPHCGVPTITDKQKLRATAAWPATCPSCGKLSYLQNRIFFDLLVNPELLLLIWLLVTLALWRVGGLLIGLAVVAGLGFLSYRLRRTSPLKPISIRRSRFVRVSVLLCIAVIISWGLYISLSGPTPETSSAPESVEAQQVLREKLTRCKDQLEAAKRSGILHDLKLVDHLHLVATVGPEWFDLSAEKKQQFHETVLCLAKNGEEQPPFVFQLEYQHWQSHKTVAQNRLLSRKIKLLE
jgi:hypothetical protein